MSLQSSVGEAQDWKGPEYFCNQIAVTLCWECLTTCEEYSTIKAI